MNNTKRIIASTWRYHHPSATTSNSLSIHRLPIIFHQHHTNNICVGRHNNNNNNNNNSHMVAHHHSNRRFVYTTAKEVNIPLRRLRKPFQQVKEIQKPKPQIDFGDLELPYEHGEANIDEYLKKTSLSPWVPIPDSAARKMMDLAAVSSSDIHVDFGSGDGRVNFYAIDYSNVTKSIGIDIDENIVKVAQERLQKRHPKPNLEFVVADLLKDTDHPIWEQIQDATVITMYFATEGLEAFRPIFERKMIGKKCKVVTCGYEMPGWISKTNEVVNAMPLYLYEWGTYYEAAADSQLDDDDDSYQQLPNPLEQQNDKFKGMNVLDHTLNHYHPQLPMFNPNYKQDEEEWDYDWDVELESVGMKMRADTTFGHPPSSKKMKQDATIVSETNNDEAVSNKIT